MTGKQAIGESRPATAGDPYDRICGAIRDFMDETRARYRSIEDRMTALEQSLASAVETLQARADDISRDTSYVRVIATQTFAAAGNRLPQPPPPRLDAPRPLTIDRACAAHPAKGEQRIDLAEYGLTIYVMPGDDPARVWGAVLQSIHERHDHGC